MNRFIVLLTMVASLACGADGMSRSTARAGVVVLANRTQSDVRFEARPHSSVSDEFPADPARPFAPSAGKLAIELSRSPDSKWARYTVAAGDVISLPLDSSAKLSVRGAFGSYELHPYDVYYVGPRGDRVELRQIGLELGSSTPAAPALIGAQVDLGAPRTMAGETDRDARRTIAVAVYVDDDEPAVEHLWQKRLQDRIAAASKILERSCGMRLSVKSFGTWESNDAINEFELSLREFENDVRPKDGILVIGFTSQYQITRGRTHLGGTRGPLHSHILLREWSQHVSESERLELLVHELSHFLGAVHSPEKNSVMRPVLGDRQARARSFRIALDPVNAMAMSIVGEEIRDRGVTSLGQLSEPARARLEAIYATLSRSIPKDPAAAAYLDYVQRQRPR